MICTSYKQGKCTLYLDLELLPYTNNYLLFQHSPQESTITEIKSQQSEKITLNHHKLTFSEQEKTFEYQNQNTNKKYNFALEYLSYNENGSSSWGSSTTGAYLFKVFNNNQTPDPYLSFNSPSIDTYQGQLISCHLFKVSDTTVQLCLKKYEQFLHIQTHLEAQKKIREVVLNLQFENLQNNEDF